MDDDKDRKLCLRELQNADVGVKNKLSQVMGTGLIMSQQNLHNFDRELTFLFNMLDADGSGWLDADEFVEGLLRVTDGSVQNDRHLIMRVEKLCSSIASAMGIAPRGMGRDPREKWGEHSRVLNDLFEQIDTNKDGFVARDEFHEFMEESFWKEGGDHEKIHADGRRVIQQLLRPLSIDQDD